MHHQVPGEDNMSDIEKPVEKEFVFSDGITSAEFEELQRIHGKNEIPDKSKPLYLIYLELLIEPMPLMIWAASTIELAIGNYLDMCILLFILFGNATISFVETLHALEAIAKLKKSFTRDRGSCQSRWKVGDD